MRIAIFGTVGAGKSTVSKRISEELGYEIFPEPIENNPYFESYYSDMKNTVFKMQIYMLTVRSIQLTKAKKLDNVIFDRTILEDPIFVQVNHALGTMNNTDFETYNSFYENVIMPSLNNRAQFDLVVYLKTSTEKAFERIKERGRVEELATEYNYWETLNRYYCAFYDQHKSNLNFLVIDADNDNLENKVAVIKQKIKDMESINK